MARFRAAVHTGVHTVGMQIVESHEMPWVKDSIPCVRRSWGVGPVGKTQTHLTTSFRTCVIPNKGSGRFACCMARLSSYLSNCSLCIIANFFQMTPTLLTTTCVCVCTNWIVYLCVCVADKRKQSSQPAAFASADYISVSSETESFLPLHAATHT